MHVGVTAAEKDVVEDSLFGPGAFDGVVDGMNLGIWVRKVALGEGLRGVCTRCCRKCYKEATYILHQWTAD